MRPNNVVFLVCLRFSLFNEIVTLWVCFFLEDLNMIKFVFEVLIKRLFTESQFEILSNSICIVSFSVLRHL